MNKDVYEKAVRAVECEYVETVLPPVVILCTGISLTIMSFAFFYFGFGAMAALFATCGSFGLFLSLTFVLHRDFKYVIKYHMNREALIDEEVWRLER